MKETHEKKEVKGQRLIIDLARDWFGVDHLTWATSVSLQKSLAWLISGAANTFFSEETKKRQGSSVRAAFPTTQHQGRNYHDS